MEYKRIDDKEVFDILERLENVNINDDRSIDETIGKDAIITILKTQLDIRHFLRKIYRNMNTKPKVYKRPTGNSDDVIVG